MTKPLRLPSGAYELREFRGTGDDWEAELERYGEMAGRDRYEVERNLARLRLQPHHIDYRNPSAIAWLCPGCHGRINGALVKEGWRKDAPWGDCPDLERFRPINAGDKRMVAKAQRITNQAVRAGHLIAPPQCEGCGKSSQSD
jgi:hypothetical protein